MVDSHDERRDVVMCASRSEYSVRPVQCCARQTM